MSALKNNSPVAVLFQYRGDLGPADLRGRTGGVPGLLCAANAPFSSLPSGGLKCPVCSFVYGTKWEFNRHLKNKHGLKLVENEGDPKWEVTF